MTPPIIPVEDFFKNQEKSGFNISPDGQHISYTAPYEGRMNIWVRSINSEKDIRITSETDRDINSYFWANNNRILYLKDNGGDENFWLYGVNIDGSNLTCFTGFDGVRTTVIDDLEEQDDYILIGLNKRDNTVFDPYRLNIVNGEIEMLAQNPGNIQNWITDHEGKLRLAIALEGTNTSILYRATESDTFSTIITTNFKESIDPLFFTFDNKNIYASSNIGRNTSAIVLFNLDKAQETEVLYENAEFDVSTLSYSNKRKVLTAITYTSWKRQRICLDSLTQEIYNKLEEMLVGHEVVIMAANKNEDVLVVRSYSDRSLGAYYIYDLNTQQLNKIQDMSPWLNAEHMAAMKPIKYTSSDNYTIHGYLTLPVGREAKNLPVIINPHGGPWVRDTWGYDPEAQFLANRGYAVLQMNFRGSTGYGRAFWEASFKRWGRAMQNDISDGVKWLVNEGIANPKRVAIYGGSYGGYAVLAGLAFTPNLYCCGIDYVGVSNLFTLLKTIPPYWKPYLEMQYEMMGHPENDKELLEAISPVFHANNISAPLFIAQGANDPRVNKDESDQMVNAMRKRGIDIEYLVKDNEGHGFRNEENRLEFYRAMEQFLNKHC